MINKLFLNNNWFDLDLTSIFKLKDLMKDKVYRTLGEISHITNIPEASVSAGLRDFRKERFGSHILNKKYLENGLYSYQLILKKHQNGENQIRS